MIAAQRQHVVTAIADFYAYCRETTGIGAEFEMTHCMKDPHRMELYRNMIHTARRAGCCDDEFVEELAQEVTKELKRRQRMFRQSIGRSLGYERQGYANNHA